MELDFATDGGSGSRARLGLIVPQIDETVEDETFRLVATEGVPLHCTRIRNDAEVVPDKLAGMAERLPILEAAEQDLGLPVISSNQALAWHMLRSAGVTDSLPGRGRLLTI